MGFEAAWRQAVVVSRGYSITVTAVAPKGGSMKLPTIVFAGLAMTIGISGCASPPAYCKMSIGERAAMGSPPIAMGGILTGLLVSTVMELGCIPQEEGTKGAKGAKTAGSVSMLWAPFRRVDLHALDAAGGGGMHAGKRIRVRFCAGRGQERELRGREITFDNRASCYDSSQ